MVAKQAEQIGRHRERRLQVARGRPPPPAASTIRPRDASAAAQATTRRSVDNAASSGTTTIQGMRKEVRPPVSQAEKVMRPAKFAAEMRCAAPNFPVRDRKTAMPIGDKNQRKATASSSGRPAGEPEIEGQDAEREQPCEKMRCDEGLVPRRARRRRRARSDAQASRNSRPTCARTPVDRNVHFGAGQVAAVVPDCRWS